MNLLHLQYFYVVAKEGSFTKASQVLKVNQPALSRMVKQFEDTLQIVLLERQQRGVKLTVQGEPIFYKAAEIFSKVEELKIETGILGKSCQGPLLIGTTDALAQNLLSIPIQRMMEDWNQLYPFIQIGSASAILPYIVSARLEFGLFFYLPDIPTSLAITKRWPIRFHLVVSKSGSKDHCVLKKFMGSREVDDSLNPRFPILEKWKKTVPKAKISISSNSLLLHRTWVLSGVGVSVLPHFLIENDLKNKKLVDLLPNEELVFDLNLVQRKNVALSLNAKTFLQYLEL